MLVTNVSTKRVTATRTDDLICASHNAWMPGSCDQVETSAVCAPTRTDCGARGKSTLNTGTCTTRKGRASFGVATAIPPCAYTRGPSAEKTDTPPKCKTGESVQVGLGAGDHFRFLMRSCFYTFPLLHRVLLLATQDSTLLIVSLAGNLFAKVFMLIHVLSVIMRR